MVQLVWLIPALPLVGFLILLATGKRLGDPLAGWLATVLVLAAFGASCVVMAGLWNQPEHAFTQTLFAWVPAGGFKVDIGFYLDPLSMTLLFVITGIGGLIHVYAVGYMKNDPRFHQFFVYFNLFVFAMLMLVLGDNLLLTFLGWEGVGLCSYLLISFWFEKKSNASAAKKAFVTNRIGDWGFMVGIFMVFFTFGSVNYAEILPAAPGLAQSTASFIALMLFVGAVGKSAQIPLYVWLPDAMAGPTPISALIHAATMVTAGVYLMTRINPILAASWDWVPTLVAVVGVATAFLAATIGMAQRDIKKVLAFSTVSQLGYMIMAVGCGGYAAAVFHLVTHACFKACLFLGAGSVVHGMNDEQDMRRMGGLRKLMPVTAGCMVVASLAISGIPPFSGFWSKDDTLSYALNRSPIIYAVGLLTAVITAFYMFRLIYLTFWGEERWNDPVPEDIAVAVAASEAELAEGESLGADIEIHDGHAHGPIHPHESPWLMMVPVVILAFLSVVMGFINLPFGQADFLARWLEPVINLAPAPAGNEAVLPWGTATEIVLLTIGAACGCLGIFFAWLVYRRKAVKAFEPALFRNGWYYDMGLAWFMGGPGRVLFDAYAWFDSHIIDGAVNGVGVLTRGIGSGTRRLQNGYVRSYALGMAIGAVLLVAFVLTRVLNLT